MPLVKPITPHLWFDTQAREAAEFYCSLLPDSRIESLATLRDTPSGDCEVVSFVLHGQPFMAISAGPHFTFNPSVSFFLNFDPSREPDARARLDRTWAALAEGGQALMPLDAYPFSPRYGWVQDRYGLSWQLILSAPDGEPRPPVMPALLFTGEVYGQAAEAGAFYRSVFDGSREGQLAPYPEDTETDRAGALMYSDFRLGETWFAAMESGYPHGFVFNEAVSFLVHCRDQAEIDRYWAALSHVPEAEQCGWCKDRYGLSWQITPVLMEDVMASGDQAAIDRVTRAFMPMHKPDLATLEAARGED
ncbi:VOC family protein [Pseudoxanthomonas suwonensis]|uniref:3-demethylubiquinone-9 3-methyltransferase n=1 Tax=Pseudoxanthomonas suwonensis TaxID=314722 RepID=A0A0E3UPD1_9GAMM|nr:VOC family protein [Pseudoxanthomonas suwonensis]AKC87956.1 3-demethylubiquinone-9 3-methyltransferase [Pseudoxanthomonas suwonensis]